MDNSKYEAVRAKVIQVCPELMELSFGCRVLIDGGYTPRGEHVIYHKHDEVYEAVNIGHTEIMTNDTTGFTRYKKTDYATLKEILGHPIRLSHVLRAIKIRKPCCDCINGGNKYCNSGWHCRDVSHIWSMLLAKYDLTKDDLSLQSPDTIDFLFKILCE